MDWFIIVFFTFKIAVVGTGMFFAIKWHHDQGKKKKANQRSVAPTPDSNEMAIKSDK